MNNHVAAPAPTEEHRQQAKEWVVHRLGLISLAIWVVGVLIFMTVLFPGRGLKPTTGVQAGMVCLAIAALPWLAYWYLVKRVARRRAAQGAGAVPAPASTERAQ